MQDSILYIVLALLSAIIFVLINQKKNKHEDKNIEEIDNKNNQSEYYLPNLIPILIQYGWGDRMIVYNTDNENEIKGANTIEQLIELEKYAKTKKKN